MTLTVVDLAWTAGIIDGEGSIFVMQNQRKDRTRNINHILRVAVQSSDPYMTRHLKEMFPDGAEFSVQLDKRPQCSNTLKWQINGKKAARFLKLILPYLRVKHNQAKLAIEFQETTKKHWTQMTELDYENQTKLCQALKDAKQTLKIGKESNMIFSNLAGDTSIYGSPGV